MPLLEVVDLWGKVKAGLLQKNPLKGTCFPSKQTFLVTTLLHSAKVLFRAMSPELPFWGATLDLKVRRLKFGKRKKKEKKKKKKKQNLVYSTTILLLNLGGYNLYLKPVLAICPQ